MNLPSAALGVAGTAADAGDFGHLFKGCGPLIDGLDNPVQLDSLANTAGFHPGANFFFGGHG